MVNLNYLSLKEKNESQNKKYPREKVKFYMNLVDIKIKCTKILQNKFNTHQHSIH